MADEHKSDDQLKTARLDAVQIQEIAEQEQKRAAEEAAADAVTQTIDTATVLAANAPPEAGLNTMHDGRFGEKFDDELNVGSVIWVTVGVALVTLLGFLGSWWLYQWLISSEQEAAAPPLPVVAARAEERRLPSGPRLQASPETELEALRHELGERLNGYGWIDEGAGVVHIPIDRAIDLVLAEGLPTAADSAAADLTANDGSTESSHEEGGSP